MKAWNAIKQIVLVTAGTLVLAFGMATFAVPYELVAGGVTGLAVVAHRWLGISFLTVDRIVFVLTWLLFVLGLVFLGRGFALKTLLSTVLYPSALSFFLTWSGSRQIGRWMDAMNDTTALLLAALAGGALIGLGCALTFRGGGSTGGTDILALWLCKRIQRLRSATMVFLTDAAVICLGILVMGDLLLSLCGILSAFVGAAVIGLVA